MIVIDASSLAKYLLHEEGWERVSQYIRGGGIYSVDHVVKEVSNAIWKHCRVGRVIDRVKVGELYRALMKLVGAGVVAVESEERYMGRAFELSLEHGLTVYDALYVAQALQRGCSLLTSDERQARAARGIGVHTITI